MVSIIAACSRTHVASSAVAPPATTVSASSSNFFNIEFQRSSNHKNDTYVAINGATSESRKQHEPVTQIRCGGDGLRLNHGNHRIDVCSFEPELLFAIDLPFCQLRQVFGKASLERLP